MSVLSLIFTWFGLRPESRKNIYLYFYTQKPLRLYFTYTDMKVTSTFVIIPINCRHRSPDLCPGLYDTKDQMSGHWAI